MNVLVTGATGFVGGNLAREIVRRNLGWNLHALVRKPQESAFPGDEGWRPRQGDITSPESLVEAFKGMDVVFHCAAFFTLQAGMRQQLERVNVQGTQNVLKAVRAAGVSKVIFTSTGATIGIPATGKAADESTAFNKFDFANDYTLSKYRGEQVALDYAKQGMDVVVLNPVAPVGAGDIKPTPTGRFVIRLLSRKWGYFFDSITHFVHIRDVVDGHIKAVFNGRAGHKYLLGAGNERMGEFITRIAAALGTPRPRWVRLPSWFCYPAGYGIDLLKAVSGIQTPLGSASVKYAASIPRYDFRKAREELGMTQTPIENAFREARDWFRIKGYLTA